LQSAHQGGSRSKEEVYGQLHHERSTIAIIGFLQVSIFLQLTLNLQAIFEKVVVDDRAA
jgi:hypothetical protein